jgi:hypothetical protein
MKGYEERCKLCKERMKKGNVNETNECQNCLFSDLYWERCDKERDATYEELRYKLKSLGVNPDKWFDEIHKEAKVWNIEQKKKIKKKLNDNEKLNSGEEMFLQHHGKD